VEAEEEQLKVTEQVNCKLTKQHVHLEVIVKKEEKDKWKNDRRQLEIDNIQL
jgi:hypothetical protein